MSLFIADMTRSGIHLTVAEDAGSSGGYVVIFSSGPALPDARIMLSVRMQDRDGGARDIFFASKVQRIAWGDEQIAFSFDDIDKSHDARVSFICSHEHYRVDDRLGLHMVEVDDGDDIGLIIYGYRH